MKINGINFQGNVHNNSGNKKAAADNSNNSKTVYKQIEQLSNVCYKPLSFGRSKAEHKSWGASIDPATKDVSFKLFTYPDSQKVTVTVQKRNNKRT